MKDIFKIPQGNYFSCTFSPELLTNGSKDATLELQNLEVSFVPASGIVRPVHAEKNESKYVIELPTDLALGTYGIKFVGTLTNGRQVKFVENLFIEVTAHELHTPDNVLFEYNINSLNVPTYPEQEPETEDQVIPTPSGTPNIEGRHQGSLAIPEESNAISSEGSDAGGEGAGSGETQIDN